MQKVVLLILLLGASAFAGASSFNGKWNDHLAEYALKSYLNGSLNLTPQEKKDVECLAKVVFFEARGESYAGKIMVANVVLNRTRFGKPFPNTICKVVYQPHQFSWTREKWKRNTDFKSVALRFIKRERKAIRDSLEIALKYVILRPADTGIATHFSSKNDKFGRTLFVKQVGNHKFYQYLGNI